jgi:hypothetical protein
LFVMKKAWEKKRKKPSWMEDVTNY